MTELNVTVANDEIVHQAYGTNTNGIGLQTRTNIPNTELNRTEKAEAKDLFLNIIITMNVVISVICNIYANPPPFNTSE